MNNSVKAPIWFMVVALLAAAWNGLGVVAFVAEVMQTPEQLAQLPEAHQALYASKPTWVTGAFAIAVFGGLLGCLSLLARKSVATPLFVASLIGLIAQNTYYFLIAKVQESMPANSFIMPAVVFVVALALLFFSRSCTQKGWLH